MLRSIATDVDSGVLQLGHRESTDLSSAMRDLAKRLEKVPKVV